MGTIVYYQLNLDYIVAEYCVNKKRPSLQCNGKCYLSKQLKLNTATTNNDASTTPIIEAFIPLFFKEYTLEINIPVQIFHNTTTTWYIQNIIPLSVVDTIDYPPEFNIA